MAKIVNQGNRAKTRHCFMAVFAWFWIPCVLLAGPSQKVPPRVWEGTVASVEKGTQVEVPKKILKAVEAGSEDCPETPTGEAQAFEGYRFQRKGLKLIAIWGRGTCQCSPTGNCSFWVYRDVGGRYSRVLRSSMVHDFGFVKVKTHGFPDIVLWSHGSAMESPVRLWRFNGAKYAKLCSWDVVFLEDSDEAQIENNTCQAPSVKQSAPAEKP